jgi:aspartate racemase
VLKLGILGGMGPAATYEFFKMVIEKTDAAADQEHIDMILLNHATIPDRTMAIKQGNTDEIISILKQDAAFLEKSGADVIAMPCNTSHYFFEEVQKSINVTIINMVSETVLKVSELGRNKVAVLATEGTVMTGVYEKACQEMGVDCFVPASKTQKIITKIIYDQIKKGEKGSMTDFLMIEDVLKNEGCDGAILACTELSVFKENHKTLLNEFYIDAMEELAKRSILLCGGKLKTSKTY